MGETRTDAQRLSDLLSAGHRLVTIHTADEGEAVEAVLDAAHGARLPCYRWTRTDGLGDASLASGPADEQTARPEAALAAVRNLPQAAVFVMCDLLAHLTDPLALRAARDALTHVSLMGGHLVLVDAAGDLPLPLVTHASTFELSMPDREELEQIAKSTLRSFQNGGGLNIDLRKSAWGALVDNLAGLSRRHARQLVGEVVALDRALTDDDVDALVERKRELLSSSGPLEFVRAPTSMDSIGGMANLKRWLEERARSFDDSAEAFGITPPRGVLLLGVQGAGKSLCAKAIATAWRRPLLRLDAGGLYDRYVGESEKRLRDALHQAERMSPVVLWIDEIEKAFASAAAQSTDGGLSKRMFGALLTWMQDHREPVFLVATANDIAALPPELIRKGRFDEIFFVDLPGDAARRQIWTVHLEKRGRDVAKFDLDALVAASAGYSGAEIEQAVLGSLHRAFASGKEPDTAMLAEVTRASPPLSVTMEEKIGELRAWATGRCVPAE